MHLRPVNVIPDICFVMSQCLPPKLPEFPRDVAGSTSHSRGISMTLTAEEKYSMLNEVETVELIRAPEQPEELSTASLYHFAPVE